MKNKVKLLITFSCIGLLLVNMLPMNALAAESKAQSKKFSYGFITVDGIVCSVTVNCNLREYYTKSNNKVKYTSRSAFVAFEKTGSASVDANVLPARHVSSSGTVVKTFSDWKKQDYIYTTGTFAVYSRQNDDAVSYALSNSNLSRLSFTVGSSDFVLTPFKTDGVSVALSVC